MGKAVVVFEVALVDVLGEVVAPEVDLRVLEIDDLGFGCILQIVVLLDVIVVEYFVLGATALRKQIQELVSKCSWVPEEG